MIVLTPDLEAQKREQEKKAQFEALVKRANSEDPIAAFKQACSLLLQETRIY